MDEISSRVSNAFVSRYTIEREFGAGGMGPRMHTDGSGLTPMIAYE